MRSKGTLLLVYVMLRTSREIIEKWRTDGVKSALTEVFLETLCT